MEQIITINPNVSMDLWKTTYEFNLINRVVKQLGIGGYQKSVSKFLDKERLCAQKIKDIVKYVDALIEDNTGKRNVLWGAEPDTSNIYVYDKERQNGPYLPPVKTKNTFTYQSLIDIFYNDKQTKTIMFMLSEKCNLACKYCFEDHVNKEELSIEDAEAFVEQIFTDQKIKDYIGYDEHKAIILEFMGGEPLLHVDLIDKICEKFYECCVKYEKEDWLIHHQFNITTNGTLYFTEETQYLISKYPEIALSISIDGTKECHDSARVYKDGRGSFDDVLKAIQTEKERGRLRMPKMTFSKETIGNMADNIAFMSTLGYPGVSVSPALESEYTKEDGVKYYEELIKIADFLVDNHIHPAFFDPFNLTFATERPKGEPFCGGEGGMLTVAPGGNYYTCHRFREKENSKKKTCIGNIKEGFCNTKEAKENYDYIISHGIFNKTWPAKCEGCKFRGSCNGCPAIAYNQQGDLEGDVNINGCYLTLAKFAANIYYRAKSTGTIGKKYLEKEKSRFLEFLPESEVSTLIEIERCLREE